MEIRIEDISKQIVISDERFIPLVMAGEGGAIDPVARISLSARDGFKLDHALEALRADPALGASLLSLGNGASQITIIYAGNQSRAMDEDGRTMGCRFRQASGQYSVASGDNLVGEFLMRLRDRYREYLVEHPQDEVPVRKGQVVSDFIVPGSFSSEIQAQEKQGREFIHTDPYVSASRRNNMSKNGTTGHNSRRSDAEAADLNNFICPFGTRRPAQFIVGSDAEASMYYEQALRGELDWNVFFDMQWERGLMSAMNPAQKKNAVREMTARFSWMREQICNDSSLRDKTIVTMSLLTDGSVGRSVADAEKAPSPGHILARYINNPGLLFLSSENGTAAGLESEAKNEPERFGVSRRNSTLRIFVAGSDTIGGRIPGRSAVSARTVVRELGEDGKMHSRIETNVKFPFKELAEAEADYQKFAARMDEVLSDIPSTAKVEFVVGDSSSLSNNIGVGTPRMVERYVRERGGDVQGFDYIKQERTEFSGGKRDVERMSYDGPALSAVMLEYFAKAAPVLCQMSPETTIPLDGSEPAVLSAKKSKLACSAALVFSSSDDTRNGNVLSLGSYAASAGLPVVHCIDLMSTEDQKVFLKAEASASISTLMSEVVLEGDGMLVGNNRRQWPVVAAQANILSFVDDSATVGSGLATPDVANVRRSTVTVHSKPFHSPLGTYVALVGSEAGVADDAFLAKVQAAEGSVIALKGIYDDILKEYNLRPQTEERLLRQSVRMFCSADEAFRRRLLDMDANPVVMPSTFAFGDLFVDKDGQGANAFGFIVSDEIRILKDNLSSVIASEEAEIRRSMEASARREKKVTLSRAEGQKVVTGLPNSIEASKDRVIIAGTADHLPLQLPEGTESFLQWVDEKGNPSGILNRETASSPYVVCENGERIANNGLYIFGTNMRKLYGRSPVFKKASSKDLTGIVRVDPVTGRKVPCSMGIPVKVNDYNNEPNNDDGLPCSYIMDNKSRQFLDSLILADSTGRSLAISESMFLCACGRPDMYGQFKYDIAGEFGPQVWKRVLNEDTGKTDWKLVKNLHRAPACETHLARYFAILESGHKYPLNIFKLPKKEYLWDDSFSEEEKVRISNEFMADFNLVLKLANATAVTMNVPLQIPVDKDGIVDLGPGVPMPLRQMATKKFDSFIGVVKALENEGSMTLTRLKDDSREFYYRLGQMKLCPGERVSILPDDLVMAFGPYEPIREAEKKAPIYKMFFGDDNGHVFYLCDFVKRRRNEPAQFQISTNTPELVPEFLSSLQHRIAITKQMDMEVRLLVEGESGTEEAPMEAYVNLMPSNSVDYVDSQEAPESTIGRERDIFNGDSRFDGQKDDEYWGREEAKDGFKGYVQVRSKYPDGSTGAWHWVTDERLKKNVVLDKVSRVYGSFGFNVEGPVPSPEELRSALIGYSVRCDGSFFRSEDITVKEVVPDDKMVSIEEPEPKKKESQLYVSYYASRSLPKDAYLVRISSGEAKGVEPDAEFVSAYPDFDTMTGPWKKHEITDEEYIERYNRKLEQNKEKILKGVEKLRELADGRDIVFQCFEKPGDFCHRYLLNNFLVQNGIECNELPGDRERYDIGRIPMVNDTHQADPALPFDPDIREFRGEYRYLSNFWKCKISYDGMEFESVENAYQAAKCKNPEDRAKFVGISSSEAKKLGRTVEVREDWEDVKVSVMNDIIRSKFSDNNPDLKQMLANTGDVNLVEGNSWGDTFWGVDLGTGRGENQLGKILMEVRSEVREELEKKSERVSNSSISFSESEGGYAQRTVENANAEGVQFTFAFAADFSTAGERKTASAAGDSYIGFEIPKMQDGKLVLSDKVVCDAVDYFTECLPDEFVNGEPMGVNLAGNGIYTFSKYDVSQEQVDDFICRVFAEMEKRGLKFDLIRSGGQTGVDQSAAAVGKVLGIPVEIHAPKGYAFRIDGKNDIFDKKLFMARFDLSQKYVSKLRKSCGILSLKRDSKPSNTPKIK